MKVTRRFVSLLLALVIAGSFSIISSGPALAAGNEDQMTAFFSDPETAKETLNELSSSQAIDINSVMLYDGTPVRIETRELKVSDDLTIVNTRTYVSTYAIEGTQVYSIEDRYGLFYAGFQGAGGYLIARYTYYHPVIDSPNQMKTQFLYADADTEELLDGVYKCTSTRTDFDSVARYDVSASAEFDISVNQNYLFPDWLPIWLSSTYINTCNIDKYGVAHFSWG